MPVSGDPRNPNRRLALTDDEIASTGRLRNLLDDKNIDRHGMLTVPVTGGTGGVPAFRVVYVTKTVNTIQAADATNVTHAGRVIGMTFKAVSQGSPGEVQVAGEIENANWRLTPGDTYFLTAGGELTTKITNQVFVQRIGVAKKGDTLVLNIGEPLIRG